MLTKKTRTFVLLGVMIAFCAGLSLLRIAITGNGMYLFLVWNLFLAFIPLLFSEMLHLKKGIFNWGIIRWSVVGVWLLFFPNAPYILTDLFHLHQRAGVPVWFDLILILSYAWTGLWAGMISLRTIQEELIQKTFKKGSFLVIITLLFITGFGIYLGRFLRFNSWDLIQEPGTLVKSIAERFIHPFQHPRTWGVTLGMGALLNFMYWGPKFLNGEHSNSSDN